MRTIEEYGAFLAEVRQLTGLDMLVPDEGGLVSVRIDDKYNMGLQYIEGPGRVLCFVEVTELPKDAPKAVYRELLAGSLFGSETAGGYFSLERENEIVVYNYLFNGDDIAKFPQDFVHTLEDMIQVCDLWAERINELIDKEMGSVFPSEEEEDFPQKEKAPQVMPGNLQFFA